MNLTSGLESAHFVFYGVAAMAQGRRQQVIESVLPVGRYMFLQLRNRSMRRSPLKRETAAKYLSGLFRESTISM